MFKNASHITGDLGEGEILFQTPFRYMFRELAESDDCKMLEWPATQFALEALGTAMGAVTEADNSATPSIYTYLGQFIDHDITARSDRDHSTSIIGGSGGLRKELRPLKPADVEYTLMNGRRPTLDLDNVYGDGPSLVDSSNASAQNKTRADELFQNFRLKSTLLASPSGAADVPRNGRSANIADGRNDENLNISQLHAAFLAMHNRVMDNHSLSGASGYSEARRLMRWCYQYVVLNDYLTQVCDANVINDILVNGNRFYLPDRGSVYMPLEFSVAGFRFGHAMIRPTYKLNDNHDAVDIMQLLDFARDARLADSASDFLEPAGDGSYRIKSEYAIAFSNYVSFGAGMTPANLAQKINPKLSKGLDDLPFDRGRLQNVLGNLAQRNLMRGYLLSIPTGQSVAYAMGEQPLDAEVLQDSINELANNMVGVPSLKQILKDGIFKDRTPLWFYLLQEADTHTGGESLGSIGSRLVGETIVGLVSADTSSYLHYRDHPRVDAENGILLDDGSGTDLLIHDMPSLLEYAGVHK